MLNVANPSRETIHSDLGAVLNEGFHCTALKKISLHIFCDLCDFVKSIVNISNRGSNIENRTENLKYVLLYIQTSK